MELNSKSAEHGTHFDRCTPFRMAHADLISTLLAVYASLSDVNLTLELPFQFFVESIIFDDKKLKLNKICSFHLLIYYFHNLQMF